MHGFELAQLAPHPFHLVTEDLSLLVFFALAEVSQVKS
jgi:hypothetical protein